MASGRGGVLVGAIEGGGTKFICAVGHASGAVLERAVMPTADARATLAGCLRFFEAAAVRHGPVRALGIACFGPLQLRKDAGNFGSLLATPKAGWSGVDVLGPFGILQVAAGARATGPKPARDRFRDRSVRREHHFASPRPVENGAGPRRSGPDRTLDAQTGAIARPRLLEHPARLAF